MKKAVWISYDLGVKGDYDGLYRWLDLHKAIECAGTTAFVSIEEKEDIVTEMKKSLKESVATDERSRIYIIYRKAGKVSGKFLFGTRKAPPWTGFGPSEPTVDTEDG